MGPVTLRINTHWNGNWNYFEEVQSIRKRNKPGEDAIIKKDANFKRCVERGMGSANNLQDLCEYHHNMKSKTNRFKQVCPCAQCKEQIWCCFMQPSKRGPIKLKNGWSLTEWLDVNKMEYPKREEDGK